MNDNMSKNIYDYIVDNNLNTVIVNSYLEAIKEKKPSWCSDFSDEELSRMVVILFDSNKAKELCDYLNSKVKKELPPQKFKVSPTLEKPEQILTQEEVNYLTCGMFGSDSCGSDTHYLSSSSNYNKSIKYNKHIINELKIIRDDLKK